MLFSRSRLQYYFLNLDWEKMEEVGVEDSLERIKEALKNEDLIALKSFGIHLRDVRIGDKRYTPLHLAMERRYLEGARYLLSEKLSKLDDRDIDGNTPLHVVCQKGHKDFVKVFLSEFNTELTNNDGCTILHATVANQQLELLSYLVEDVHLDPLKLTVGEELNCLHIACKEGNLEIVKYLVEKAGVDPESRTGPGKDKRYPVHFAALHSHLNILKYLVDECNCSPNAEDDFSKTPALLAGDGGNVDIMKYLVEVKGCNPNHPASANGKVAAGRVALHGASFQGSAVLVRYLVLEQQCPAHVKDGAGVTPLACAAQEGRKEVVRILCSIKESFDPNVQDETGRGPLHYASMKGRMDVVVYLTSEEVNADIDLLDNAGETPVIVAAKNGQLDIVNYLIKEKQCNVVIGTSSGKGLLAFAATNDWVEIVKILITEKHLDPEALNEVGFPAMHYAIEGGAMNVMKYLLEERKCNPDIFSQEGDSGTTPLLKACMLGKLDAVKYLIKERKCNIKLTSKNKMMTPLHLACSNGHEDVVKFLLQDCQHELEVPNCQDAMPLHMAILNGHLELSRYLIEERNADPMKKTKGGATGIHAACQGGHMDVLLYLLENPKYNRNWHEELGSSPLDQAAEQGHFEIVRHLVLNVICDPQKRGSNGFTALHWACLKGHTEIVQFLTDEEFCDVLTTDFKGHLPLHLACDKGHFAIIKQLLSKNPKQVLSKDLAGLTPLQHAKRSNTITKDILLEFIRCGADSELLLEVAPIPCKFMKSFLPLYSYMKVFLLGESVCLARQIEQIGIGDDLITSCHQLPVWLFYKSNFVFGDTIFYEVTNSVVNLDGVLSDAVFSCERPVFVVGIDSLQGVLAAEYQSNYWLQFISTLLHLVKNPTIEPTLLFAIKEGENIDLVESEAITTHLLSLSIPDCKQLLSTQIIHFNIDCEQPYGLPKILNFLSCHGNMLQQSLSLKSLPIALRAFTIDQFKGELYCQLSDIAARIIAYDAPLPTDTKDLSDIFKTLCQNGYILFLKNIEDVAQSWVVLEVDTILAIVQGAIRSFKPSSTVGLASFAELVSKAEDFNPSLFINILKYLGTCSDVSQMSIVKKRQQHAKLEPLFFFPGLLPAIQPQGLVIHTNSPHDLTLGWLVQSEPPCTFSMDLCTQLPVVAATSTDPPLSSYNKQNGSYHIWNGGIHWNEKDIQSVVTHLRGEAILVIVNGPRQKKLALARKRSQIVQDILTLKEDLCPELHTQEFLLHPSCLTTFHVNEDPDLAVIPISYVIATLGQTEQAFQCSCEDLAGFEPLFLLRKSFTDKIFNPQQSDSPLSIEDIQHLSMVFASYSMELAQILGEPFLPQRDSKSTQFIVSEWIRKGNGSRTYRDLWNCLKDYSIFSTRKSL